MSDSVENKIVSIKFDNASFQSKMAETIKALDDLNKNLKLKDAGKGFSDISAAANKVDLGHIESALDHIKSKFSVLGVAGITAISKLTLGVFDFAKKTAESVLDPIITGGKSRALKIEQAKFMFRGLGIDVEGAMASAKEAVLGTAFGLDEAAKAAAQFGAGGIQVGTQMTNALRGVAGAAALTGRSFSEIADIFASSAALGKVTNQDLDQFATRGLNAAAAIGKVLGKNQEQIHKMAKDGKLDFQTFAAAMNTAFGEHATKANETFQGSLDNLHAAMSRLGASIIGPQLEIKRTIFNAMTPQIDNLTKTIKPLVDAFILLRTIIGNKLIKTLNGLNVKAFQAGVLGGVVNLQSAFIKLYHLVVPILKTIRDAFKEFFPVNAFKSFTEFTVKFNNFVQKIKIGVGTLGEIKNVFRGVFAALSIGVTVIKEVGKFFFDLVKAVFPIQKDFLAAGSGAGLFLVKLQGILVKGGAIHDFFDKLSAKLAKPKELFGQLAAAISTFIKIIAEDITKPKKLLEDLSNAIGSFFDSNKTLKAGKNRVSQRLDEIRSAAESVSNFWDRLKEKTEGIRKILSTIADYITNWFHELGHRIAQAFQPGDFDAAVDLVNVGLLGGIALLLRKFVKDGLKIDFGSGVISKMEDAFNQLTGTLKAMQSQLKAKALLNIALAIGVLTASLVVLSLIDSKALTKALAAITISFGELIGTLTAIDKLKFSATGVAKLQGIGTAMILLSSALLILSGAVAIFASIDPPKLASGLSGIGASLSFLVAAAKLLEDNEGGIISASIALGLMAGAIDILAAAVLVFAHTDSKDLTRGLLGVAASLTILVGAALVLQANEGGIISAGLAMIPMAIGLNILAGAVAIFGTMNWETLAKGLGAIAVALGIIAVAMNFMPLDLPITAAGILILSVAMNVMAEAVKKMGENDLGTLAKGIGAFAIMLGILVFALTDFELALPGAAAMVLIAGSMLIFADVLTQIGKLKIAQLAVGLGAIAAVLGLLGLAAFLMEPLIPALLGLGLALGVIGVAFAIFGASVFLVAKGFQILAESGAAGAKAFVKMLGIIGSSSTAIADIVAGMAIHFIEDLLNALPLLLRLLTAVIDQILATIIKEVPKIARALVVLIKGILQVIRTTFPDFVNTGIQMILALLRGIREHITEITNLISDIIVQFLDALTNRIDDIVNAGANLILSFLNGISQHLSEIVAAGVNILVQFLNGIAQGITLIANAAAGVITAYIEAIGNNINRIVTKGVDVVIAFIQGIASNALRLVNAAGQTIVSFLNGLADAINKYAPQIRAAGLRVIVALINGMTGGLLTQLGPVIGFFTGFAGKVLGWIGNVAGTLIGKGKDIIGGLFGGITQKALEVATWFGNLGGTLLNLIKDPGKILLETGKKVMRGLWDGLKEIWKDVKDWLSKLNPTHWFNDINPEKGHAERNMLPTGRLVMGGLLNGMKEGWTQVTDWLRTLNPSTNVDFSGIQKSVSQIPKTLEGLDEFNPTITPVLDLSQVKSQANTIGDFFSIRKISPEVSLDQAKVLSALQAQAAQTAAEDASSAGPSQVIFEQTINAPTALSTGDIYRNTKSQIVLAKEKLGVS